MAANTDHRRGRKRWRRWVDGEGGGVEAPKMQTWKEIEMGEKEHCANLWSDPWWVWLANTLMDMFLFCLDAMKARKLRGRSIYILWIYDSLPWFYMHEEDEGYYDQAYMKIEALSLERSLNIVACFSYTNTNINYEKINISIGWHYLSVIFNMN